MAPKTFPESTDIYNTIMSKKTFCKILNHLKRQSELYSEVNESMSKLCPGFQVNFYPHCENETLMIDILNEQFGFTGSGDSMIDWFVFDTKYGTEPLFLSVNGHDVDLSTPEQLYDFLLDDLRSRFGLPDPDAKSSKPKSYYAKTDSKKDKDSVSAGGTAFPPDAKFDKSDANGGSEN